MSTNFGFGYIEFGFENILVRLIGLEFFKVMWYQNRIDKNTLLYALLGI